MERRINRLIGNAGVANSKHERFSILVLCLFLAGAEYILYSANFRQFFQGDAIFWTYYRFRDIEDFLRALVTLDVANWYRPLSNRTIPSLLFPILGLRPYGYHLVVFACFFATTCVVFFFLNTLTRRTSTAFIAAFYFSIHSINFYTTYDFAFSPEVFYVFFYICAVWFFLLAEQQCAHTWRAASVGCCVLSLMSKEAAVTFPAMLLATHLFFIRQGIVRALRAIWMHVVLWITYLLYVVGHLGVGGGDYMLVVHTNVINNLISGLFYAFNLRRDGFLPTRMAPQFVFVFLVAFAVVLLVIAVFLMFRRQRALVGFGALWFGIGLTPMLMLNGLGPYYVFLSLVGFSLIVGVCLDYLAGKISVYSKWGARVTLGGLLSMFWLSCQSILPSDTSGDIALGYASRWAEKSVTDILKALPRPRRGTKIYILNDSMPDLWRFHGLGNLFRLVYQDDTIITLYRSVGQGPGPEAGDFVVMNVEGEQLVDVTDAFRTNPEKFIRKIDDARFTVVPGVHLTVNPPEAVAGRDFYWLSVTGLDSDDIVVRYTIDEGPIAEARFKLNPEGKLRFFVSSLTPVGTFHFIGFRSFASPANEWIRADARLRVLPPSP
jgi:hypothetical protein